MEAANIVLSPLLQVIFDRLASPTLQKLSDIWSVKDNHDSLQRDLMRVQAILQDAGEKQLTNKSVRLWLSNLKNAASDAEDLLDSFITQETIKGYDAEDLLSVVKSAYRAFTNDIWTENQDDWDKLRPLFRGDVDGCKIIVTTRNTKTAFMTDSPNSPFYLKGLAEDDCWALFKQRAFGRTEEEKYPWLLSIGKQMVKKCGGVPLAVKSLGSLMRFKREEQQSLFMQNSDLWKLDACQNKVLPALMLSYIHLPSHLKQCFAFCSIFPRNYEFKKQKLIYLWMAEGLILQEGSKRPEDIGENYFADLLWMSFFQEVELCEGVSITGYKMNDVIHDLARYVAGKEYVILEKGAPPNGPAQIRHSSVVYTYGEITIPEALYEEKHLRTLLLIGESGSLRSIGKMFSTFVYLRSLDLSSCTVYNLPESLGIMICLRFLDELAFLRRHDRPKTSQYNWMPKFGRDVFWYCKVTPTSDIAIICC
ncbi:disease resistance protein RGA2-like [Prunus dulcis]|uniref:disease resistance protein RGA2-like n=1 Tax=Prunus dulcis TaxID=3755 RepID=UPI001483BCB3|nr:disease resistance protein RGA2-like [Prunus dulcis]